MNTDMKAKRAEYREALLMLAGLVDDLSPAGERAYRHQETLCKRLHDAIYYDEQKLFDLVGDELKLERAVQAAARPGTVVTSQPDGEGTRFVYWTRNDESQAQDKPT